MPAPTVSFEFFPPKSLEASFRLWDTVQTLSPLDPRFVSVTYGAGGTTRKLTHEAVTTIHKTSGLPVAAHLTCVDATREETLEIARGYAVAGVTRVVALRGDPPKGSGGFRAHPGGFGSSVELIEALSGLGFEEIHVGAYPEAHPEAADSAACVDYLKRKIDAGATGAITQFFFEAETFLRFRDACAAAGIEAPVVPGILPVENWTGVRKFAASCGTAIPPMLREAFDHAVRDGHADLLARAQATELCDELLEEGVEHLHFYTLNKPELTRDICHALGLSPKVALQEVA
ncbi:methylenetetrahydrofolate reductase [NAD(P)H] [Histidinibacterium aquaticum]|uniref:Methylenetetrahydrofolate reductase n=1 Tax=Histidinibacterium aquaticum TaxID=2613962 RepID=A0A5J5GKL4_9RHOB|nr:methylenetetrahydrofolate reductase [NAD(P)H] [Histidinibacterium aquaticum]KAA9008084.1 methylenetetrahydrofolate reductase [NAD(P)H] [Histidinibacterium aquaticum]